jgi:formylglycine-generating enzyme required for sulfatase activity
MTRAFIAMPFAQNFHPVYIAIREACERLGITSIRIDEVWAREDIYKQIEEEILKSDFLIADFTGDRMLEVANPNVVHEATFARVNKKYLVLIAQDHKCLPFDWRTRPAVIYQQTEEGLGYLKERLILSIQALMKKEDFGREMVNQLPYPTMPLPLPAPYPMPFATGNPAYTSLPVSPASEATPGHAMENLIRAREGHQMPIVLETGVSLPSGFKQDGDCVQAEIDGSAMAWIRKVKFLMGGAEEEDQKPVHEVNLSDFLIDIYPVTNAQYNKFMEAGGYNQQMYWTAQGWGWRRRYNIERPAFMDDPTLNMADNPVVGVSWYEAMAYAAWANKHLPTEAQWEYASRGEDERHYPWGNQKPGKKLANYAGSAKEASTTPCGKFTAGVSPCGCYDMAGNVWEWCYDWYEENYYHEASLWNPAGPKEGKEKTCRGGSWKYGADALKAFYRFNGKTTLRDKSYGFRCARIL